MTRSEGVRFLQVISSERCDRSGVEDTLYFSEQSVEFGPGHRMRSSYLLEGDLHGLDCSFPQSAEVGGSWRNVVPLHVVVGCEGDEAASEFLRFCHLLNGTDLFPGPNEVGPVVREQVGRAATPRDKTTKGSHEVFGSELVA